MGCCNSIHKKHTDETTHAHPAAHLPGGDPTRDTLINSQKTDIGPGDSISADKNDYNCESKNCDVTNSVVTTHKEIGSMPWKLVQNPLIVILGIGNYNGSWPEIIGTNRDHGNILYCFNYKRGYNVVYARQKSNNTFKIKHLNYRIKKNKQIRDRFKRTWPKHEIKQYHNSIIGDILPNGKFDGLIYFLSCHGGRGGVIYDSESDKMDLHETVIQPFDNNHCHVYAISQSCLFLTFVVVWSGTKT